MTRPQCVKILCWPLLRRYEEDTPGAAVRNAAALSWCLCVCILAGSLIVLPTYPARGLSRVISFVNVALFSFHYLREFLMRSLKSDCCERRSKLEDLPNIFCTTGGIGVGFQDQLYIELNIYYSSVYRLVILEVT